MDRRDFIKAVLGIAGIALVNPVKLLSAESDERLHWNGHWPRETDYSEVIKNEDSLANINRKLLRLRIRKDIARILEGFKFEPNTESTRKAIAATVRDYLEHLNAVFAIQKDHYSIVQENGVVYVFVTTKKSEPMYCFVNPV